MTKQVQQSITPTHVIGSTGTADTSDLGYRALGSFKSDLGLGTSLTQTANNGNGTAAAPAFTFTGDPDTGIYRPGADALEFVTNGANRMRITDAGNVGIGTTAPAAPLHVNGTLYASETLLGSQFFARTSIVAGITTVTIVINASGTTSNTAYLVNIYVHGQFNSVNRRGFAHYRSYISQEGTGDSVETVLAPTGSLSCTTPVGVVTSSGQVVTYTFTVGSGAQHKIAVEGVMLGATFGPKQVTSISISAV